jgi:hypothetical protein
MAQLLVIGFAVVFIGCAGSDKPAKQAQRFERKSEELTPMISTARREDVITISTRDVPAIKAKAGKGDIHAINKLIGYYLEHDQEAEAHKWTLRRDEILSKRRGQ